MITARASIQGAADYLYTMRAARRRFKKDRALLPGVSFRQWARRTYNPEATHGKLAAIVRAKVAA